MDVQQTLAKGMLERLGYHVETVASGEATVELLSTSTVDLLILDMIMDPGMDGYETYTRIIARHPGQKAIIASGFAETDRVKSAMKLGPTAFVKKPYRLQEIGLTVRDLLSQ